MKNSIYILLFMLISAGLSFGNPPESSFILKNGNKSIELLKDNTVRPKIALVLSGGGARGLAQVGVIKELEKNNIRVDYIIGTSIGAIIGGLYASGYTSAELEEIVREADWEEIFSLNEKQDRSDLFHDQKIIESKSLITLNFDNFTFVLPESISSGTKFNSFLQGLVWNSVYQSNGDFDKLKYPFRAVATDVSEGRSIALGKGNLVTAMRASSTVPLKYTPVRIDSLILIDGGILNNIPIEIAEEFDPDIIIAVNSTSPLFTKDKLDNPLNLADQTVSILMKKYAEIKGDSADITLTPNIGDYSNNDFSEIDFLLKKGEESVSEFIYVIEDLINEKTSENLNTLVIRPAFDFLEINKAEKDVAALSPDNQFNFKTRSDSISDLITGLALDYRQKLKNITITKSSAPGLNIELEKYPLIKHINVLNYEINFDELADSLGLIYYNMPFSPLNQTKIKEDITRYLRSVNYSFATVSELGISDGTITAKVLEGRLNEIFIKGNETVNDFLIERDIAFRKGDAINAGQLIDLWLNLINTDLFADVQIQMKKKESNDLDLYIEVKEKALQTLHIGGRVDNERQAQGAINFIHENFLNRGARLNYGVAGGFRNQSAVFNFQNPRIFKTNLGFDLKVYYDSRDVWDYTIRNSFSENSFTIRQDREYVEQKFGGVFSILTQLEKKGILYAGIKGERQRSYLKSVDDVDPFYTIFNTIVGAVFDSEDKAYFPETGSKFNMSFETSLAGLFDDPGIVSYTKIIFDYSNHYTIGRLTFNPKLYLGVADETLPLPDFFSLGGQHNFFGFQQDAVRGRQKFLTSFSIRYNSQFALFFPTYIAVRYDFGSAWEFPEAIKLSTLRHGTGMELSFDTPLGPAGFALGKSFFFTQNPYTIVWGPFLGYFSIGVDF